MIMFDPMYLYFALPGLALALLASWYTKSTFKKFSNWQSPNGLTGAQAAHQMLSSAGISNVRIEQVSGFLSDHYDPVSKVLRLSPSVYSENSLSAVGVACHEAGHAIQHARSYAWLHLRTAMVPLTNISSWFSYIVITLGFMFSSSSLVGLGAILFSGAVIFSLITLPVEWDASRRAKLAMAQAGLLTSKDAHNAGKVLDAAFLTYVAAAASSILTLLYYLFRAGVLGRSND